MTAKQIFNTDSLLHYTENDRELSAQILRMALQDIPDFLSEAGDYIKKKRFRDSAVLIHKIKGIAGTVGADTLYSLCISTEEILKNTDSLTEAESLLGSLTKSIDEFSQDRDVQDWISDVLY